MDRAPRWIFLLLTLGVLAWSVQNVPWKTHYFAPGETHSRMTIVHGERPLWSAPPSLTVAEFAASWSHDSDTHIDPAGRTVTGIWWGMWLEGTIALWVLFAALLWPVFFFARSRRPWNRALRFSLGLFAGAALCFGLWLIFGGWGPPSPILFALLGIFLGWRWSRRAPPPPEPSQL
jgi:hypothetical protein